jgi:hypothetical protein
MDPHDRFGQTRINAFMEAIEMLHKTCSASISGHLYR